LVRAGGAGYLSDEIVAIDPAEMRLHGYPKPLTLKVGAQALYPEQDPRTDGFLHGWIGDNWHLPLPPHDLLGTGLPDLVVFPERQPFDDVEVVPLGRAEAAVRLGENSSYLKDVPDALGVLKAVVMRASSYVVRYGDRRSAATAIADLARSR
jgi:hypothetical protein